MTVPKFESTTGSYPDSKNSWSESECGLPPPAANPGVRNCRAELQFHSSPEIPIQLQLDQIQDQVSIMLSMTQTKLLSIRGPKVKMS